MSKTFDKFITVLDYADKILLVLSSASSCISHCSCTTVVHNLVVLGHFAPLRYFWTWEY